MAANTEVCTFPACELGAHCKTLCKNHYEQTRYRLNRDKWNSKAREKYHVHKEWARQRRAKNARTTSGRYTRSKSLAKRRGIPWALTKEEFSSLITSPCFYCKGVIVSTRTGLDRVDNNGGYEVTNVIPCCYICNTTRNLNWSVGETLIMIQAVLAYRARKVA